MNVAFLGATRGIGRHLARAMAERGDRLFLLGRSAEDLDRTAQDFALRAPGGARPGIATCDLERHETLGPALDAAQRSLGRLDVVVLSAAIYRSQEELEHDPAGVRRLLDVDLTNTIAFCEDARRRLLAQGGGTLCVFSSVAGDRGRLAVAIYGAAKAGLSHYLESLDHGYGGRDSSRSA